jgi:superfamily I DNA/RNA helicase
VVDDATRGLYKRDPQAARRLAYTGVTRAKETLLVADI